MRLLVNLLFLTVRGPIGLYCKIHTMKTMFTIALFCLTLAQTSAQLLETVSDSTWDGFAMNLSFRDSLQYDQLNRYTGSRYFQPVGPNNSLIEIARIQQLYDQQGRPFARYSFNISSAGGIDTTSRYFQFFASNGLLERAETEFKDMATGTWQNTKYIQKFKYNAMGVLDTTFDKSITAGSTTVHSATKYFFNSLGKLTQFTILIPTAGVFEPVGRQLFEYDALNRLVFHRVQDKELNGTGYVEMERLTYYHTANRMVPDSMHVDNFRLPTSSTNAVYYAYDSNDSLIRTQVNNSTRTVQSVSRRTYKPLSTSVSPIQRLEFTAYPNPTIDQLHIQLTDPQLATVSIQSFSGQTIKQLVLAPGQSSINLQDLPTGMYLLHLQAGGKSAVHKLVKQ